MSEKKKKAPKVSHLDEDVYDVESIVGSRLQNGQTEYLVKWLGYPEEQNSWEPDYNIFDRSLIVNFEKQEEFDKSKKLNLITNAKSSSSNREDIRHSSKMSSKKRRRLIEDSSEEEEEEKQGIIPSSSTGRSSTKSHKDKDRHHRKHKHRSDHHHHDKHRHKSSKLLKGDSESSSLVKKKKKHHEHDDDDILTEARAERAQADHQSKSKVVNSRGKTFQEFFERVKGKPKLCTPITCNGTTFTITEYLV